MTYSANDVLLVLMCHVVSFLTITVGFFLRVTILLKTLTILFETVTILAMVLTILFVTLTILFMALTMSFMILTILSISPAIWFYVTDSILYVTGNIVNRTDDSIAYDITTHWLT